ncbi:MAG: ferredoxin--NADP reductase [Rickettsiales bacterium]|jgi:ferredoxin--NADP+ reductase|nr:ferredoxin--NADP reductase [Rickettsiales bacterium]
MANASIISVKEQTPGIRIFRIRPFEGIFDFQPGQFAMLELDGVKRAYTIASSPDKDYLEFIIILVKDGQLTPKLWKLAEGDEIDIMPRAFGHIRLSEIPAGAPLLLIGTGTGIAMMKSILDSGALKTRKITLLNGARFAADLGFREEFGNIQDKNLTLVQVASREPWNGHQGRLSSVFENPVFNPMIHDPDPSDGTHIIICGGPEMVDDFVMKFKDLGFAEANAQNPGGNLHFEKY